ncbi:hypothetical protein DIPPA_06835 [Diplonema papillatum]|nr:hypothetical protein DIPPA_06835 [Diplonema papillatum]
MYLRMSTHPRGASIHPRIAAAAPAWDGYLVLICCDDTAPPNHRWAAMLKARVLGALSGCPLTIFLVTGEEESCARSLRGAYVGERAGDRHNWGIDGVIHGLDAKCKKKRRSPIQGRLPVVRLV